MMKSFKIRSSCLSWICVSNLLVSTTQVYAVDEAVMEEIVIKGKRTNDIMPTFPSTAIGIDAKEIADTVNAVDTPDALKYFPGLFVRKRDSADYNGAPISSRVWGNAYSAKSIVTVDGVPITNQIFQNNSYGSPKWWVTSPDSIRNIEVMYGPYSAAYSGNSVGATVNIATAMPDSFTGTANVTQAIQHFSLMGTSDDYSTTVANAMLGNTSGDLSWRLSLSREDARTQPRSFITGGTSTTTSYSYQAKNSSSVSASYLGAGGIIHGISDSMSLKLAYKLTPELTLGFLTSMWTGDSDASLQTYTGNYSTGTWQSSSTASAYYLDQKHLMNAISLKTDADRQWSWEIALSKYDYFNDKQRWGGTLNTDGTMKTSASGYVADYSGTGWSNFDYRSNYKLDNGEHTLSYGYHYDTNIYKYLLTSGTGWSTEDSLSTNNTIARGASKTQAIWAQDFWKYSDYLTLTAGIRLEGWNAYDGYNLASTGATSNHSSQSANAISPKLSATVDGPDNWLTTASMARTTRFPTLTELYGMSNCLNTISTCTDTTYKSTATGNLSPEIVTSAELSFEKTQALSNYRVTIFGESVKDAILQQYGYLYPSVNPSGLYQYWQNVEKVHAYGIELAGNFKNAGITGLDIYGQVTRVWSAIDESSSLGSSAQSVEGNPITYVSPWRATVMASYRPDEKLTYSMAGRYQEAGASSLDNNDVKRDTYGGFQSFFVIDAKVRYQLDRRWSASFGIDNIENKTYWIYHPFPQRTFIFNLKYVP